MKKKLESELISIAHRILKLKGKEDIIALQTEAKQVYEKLTVLKFAEEHFGTPQPTIGKKEVVDKISAMKHKVMDEKMTIPENNPHEDDIITPGMTTIKDIVAEMPKKETLDDILADISPTPEFVKPEIDIDKSDFDQHNEA